MKIGVAALAALALVCAATAANAQSQGMARRSTQSQSYTYAFGEYDHYAVKGGTLNGGGLGAGWHITRFFGVEAGGQYARKSGVDYTNGYVQGLVFLPLGARFSLVGSIGGAYARASTSVGPITISTTGSGYRAGVGVEYWLAPQWGLRAGFHRQNALSVTDDYGVGIAYKF